MSITNAELMAIRLAIRICMNKANGKSLILTDSKSACEALKNKYKATNNLILLEIHYLLQEALEQRLKITIQWIPSHVGIEGNEAADKLAVETTKGQQTNFEPLTVGDTITLMKNEIWDSWTEQYKQISETKGIKHFKIMDKPSRTIWCKQLNLNTDDKITLSRIRTYHCMTKERKHSWGWEINSSCDLCQEEENIEHILYHCAKWIMTRSYYKTLEELKPLEKIFKDGKITELKDITNFLKEIEMRI